MKLRHAIALTWAAAACALTPLACQSVHVKNDGNGWEIEIEGDDGETVDALSLEEALKLAYENLMKAQQAQPPDPELIKAWKDIVNQIIEEKKKVTSMETPDFEYSWEAGDPIPDEF